LSWHQKLTDLEFLKQQIDAKALDKRTCKAIPCSTVKILLRAQGPSWRYTFDTSQEYIENRAKRICETFDSAQSLEEEMPDVVTFVTQHVIKILSTSKIDKSNIRLCQIAPVVRDHGVGYEQGKLKDTILKTKSNLTHTEVKTLLGFWNAAAAAENASFIFLHVCH